MKLTIKQLQSLLSSLYAEVDASEVEVNVSINVTGDVELVSDAQEVLGFANDTVPAPLGKTADDFPVGSDILWDGARFRGEGTVIKHNDDGSISVYIFDTVSQSDKRVNLNRDDIASGRLSLGSQPVADTPAPGGRTQSDFPVGSSINWAGRLFNGSGAVIKHNDDGGLSVRIMDTFTRSTKRVKLSADDIATALTLV